MLIKTSVTDLKRHYKIELVENNIDSCVTKFLKSMRSYKRRSPDLFNQKVPYKEESESIPKKKVKKDLKKKPQKILLRRTFRKK